ncbi:MAG: DUF2550 domain-containing protein [Nocardioides sp.]|uniref:DUF2550 domain-containing protein n=1 Tax=Nocardioides sp. TaxID=35761 RepID=UPI003EFE088A
MPLWQLVLDVVGVLLFLALLYGVALILRRRWLSRRGATFELSFRRADGRPGHGWMLGVGRYTGPELEWYRVFSLSPRPKAVWSRDRISYESRRAPEGPEVMSLYDDHVVVSCLAAGEPVDLAMSEASLMGFQAWVESGPPGTDWNRTR